jgi:hypothetical protein
MKNFIEFFVFNELLLEGGYDPLEANNKVEIKFGIIDRENRSKLENQTIQLWLNNLLSENEARQRLGYAPDVDKNDTYFKLYQEPLALLKVMGPFNAASKALSESKTSSISEEGLAKEEENEGKKNESRGQKGLTQEKGPENLSNNISRPANQNGARSAPKFSNDIYFKINNTIEDIESFFKNRLDNKNESTLEYTMIGLEKNELIFDFIVEVKNILKNLKYNNKNINIEDVQTSNYAVIYNFCEQYKAKLINSEKK